MTGVRITIARFLGEEPQPGVVECQLLDAHGRSWSFIEKTSVVSAAPLDARTAYPQPGTIAVEVLSRSHDGVTGRETVWIDTARPWGMESVEGETRFEVSPESLVELATTADRG